MSRILECVSVAGSSHAFQCWWRAPSHKEAALRLLPYPSLPITQAIETDEILFSLHWFLCIPVFSLCPWRPPNPIGRVLVLERSREDRLYPVMPLTLNKSSRVGGELHGRTARQGHHWKMAAFWWHCCLVPIETEWIWGASLCWLWKLCFFEFLEQASSCYNFYSSDSRTNLCLRSPWLPCSNLFVEPVYLQLLTRMHPCFVFSLPFHLEPKHTFAPLLTLSPLEFPHLCSSLCMTDLWWRTQSHRFMLLLCVPLTVIC